MRNILLNASSKPTLIAHRGYSECYPENTLAGLEAALRVGAQCIEFDVHFTADGVPVVFHDTELARVTGSEGRIEEVSFATLSKLRASEKDRFGEKFLQEPVPSLQDVLALLQQWPDATAFVEIKTATVKYFGVETVVQGLMAALANFQTQCILTSFDRSVLEAARNSGMQYIGWVLREWDSESYVHAQSLLPDVLICNADKIGADELWPGPEQKPWQWALYDIVDPDEALRWFARGADFIETWDIGGMLRDSRLRPESS